MFALVEEACFASHLLAWRQFLNSGHERGLILEDDAEPFPGFEEAMARLLSEGPPIDIVKFEGIYRKGGRLAIPVRDLGAAKTRALAASVLRGSSLRPDPRFRAAADRIRREALLAGRRFHLEPGTAWLRHRASVAMAYHAVGRGKHDGHDARPEPARQAPRSGSLPDARRAPRSGLRFSLWRNALQGSPLALLSARQAPLVPAGFRQECFGGRSPRRGMRSSNGRTHAAKELQGRPGKTWPKPEGASSLREYRVYRWIPDDGENPRMDTYFVDLDDCGPMVLDGLIVDQEQGRSDADAAPLLPRRHLRLLRDEHRRRQHARLHQGHGRDFRAR